MFYSIVLLFFIPTVLFLKQKCHCQKLLAKVLQKSIVKSSCGKWELVSNGLFNGAIFEKQYKKKTKNAKIQNAIIVHSLSNLKLF